VSAVAQHGTGLGEEHCEAPTLLTLAVRRRPFLFAQWLAHDKVHERVAEMHVDDEG